MKRNAVITMSTFLLALTAQLASASAFAVPLRWTVETSRAQPATFEAYQGETLELEAALTSYGKPLEAPSNYSLYWQTNGMGSAWWSAPVSSAPSPTNVLFATWSPTNDVGAKTYTCFIGQPGTIYHAAFQLRLRPSPGAAPNELPLPAKTIDFAQVIVTNAPWITEETDPTVPAWAKEPIPPRSSDGAARPLPKYLHALDFDDSYPNDAAFYYTVHGGEPVSCSSVRDGNTYSRNFDFPFDDRAEFVVRMSHSFDRFASVGVAQVGTNLTEKTVTSGEWSRFYRCLPGATVDGINENGVVVNINVVDGEPAWHDSGDLHPLAAVRWVLDHATNAQHAAEYLAANIRFPEGWQQNFHYMVADMDSTYVIENGSCSNFTGRVAMTNFPRLSMTYGAGWERYAILTNAASSITNVWYTNAYSTNTNWESEFHSSVEMLTAKTLWASKPKEQHRGESYLGFTWWQTVHTSAYDITNKVLRVAVQETDDWYTFAVPTAGTDEDEVTRIASNVVAVATKDFVTETITNGLVTASILTNAVIVNRNEATNGDYTVCGGEGAAAFAIAPTGCVYRINSSVAIGNGAIAAVPPEFTPQDGAQWTNKTARSVGVAIGHGAIAAPTNSTASYMNQTVAIGYNAQALALSSVAIGGGSSGEGLAKDEYDDEQYPHSPVAYGGQGIAIGYFTKARGANSTAIGQGSSGDATPAEAASDRSVAIGYKARVEAGADDAVQIGTGRNDSAGSLKFRDYELLDASGIIPRDRLGGAIPPVSDSVVLVPDEDGYVYLSDGSVSCLTGGVSDVRVSFPEKVAGISRGFVLILPAGTSGVSWPHNSFDYLGDELPEAVTEDTVIRVTEVKNDEMFTIVESLNIVKKRPTTRIKVNIDSFVPFDFVYIDGETDPSTTARVWWDDFNSESVASRTIQHSSVAKTSTICLENVTGPFALYKYTDGVPSTVVTEIETDIGGAFTGYAFGYQKALKRIVAPNITIFNARVTTKDGESITQSGSGLMNCSVLEYADLRGLTTLSRKTFNSCAKLKEVHIEGVTSISTGNDQSHFGKCNAIESIYLSSMTVEQVAGHVLFPFDIPEARLDYVRIHCKDGVIDGHGNMIY